MPQFLGHGVNQAIQDVYCLANAIQQHTMQYNGQANGGNSLEDILQIEYKDKRWSTTTSIMTITATMAKAGLLGYLEASSGPLAKFRDACPSSPWTRWGCEEDLSGCCRSEDMRMCGAV